MGLLDQVLGNVLGGLQQGGGTSSPATAPELRGTSPMVKALLLLLAAKAFQHYTGNGGQAGRSVMPGSLPGGGDGGLLGQLGGLVSGGGGGNPLGGLLGGLVGGGGLAAVLDQFREKGYGEQVNSWVGQGQNQQLTPDQLEHALGADTIGQLAQHTGMAPDQVLNELAGELPQAVDQMTPDGRLPTEDEVQSRWT